MSLTLENENYNKNLGLNMSKRVKGNAMSLRQYANQVNGAAYKDALSLVELYEARNIPQARTVKRLITEMLNENDKKQKLGVQHAAAAITKYTAKEPIARGAEKPITKRLRTKTNVRETPTTEKPITRRLTTKTNLKITRRLRAKTNVKQQKEVLGEKIFKLFRNRLKFKITEEKAFKSSAVSVILEPTSVGAVPASDLDVFAARSYLIARRRIPKDAHFEIYASCSLRINKTDRIIHITSEKFNSKNLNVF